MENRYLHKAKQTDNGEWIIGCPVIYGECVDIIQTTKEGTWRWYPVDKSTICQCTGQISQDKTLIFEHDVVAYLDTYSTDSGYAEADCIGEVVWDEGTLSFQVTNRLSAESWEVLDGECKVLGNTIDNPELLEVQE